MDAYDEVLQWEDLTDKEGAGMDALSKLRALNYRTVLMLKALLATPPGGVAFMEITGLSAVEALERLQQRHPRIATLLPSGRQYHTGYLQKMQKDPPKT